MTFYVYVLKCKDGSLYTGYTNGLEKRLALHAGGKASKYTRSRLPVEIVFQWSFRRKPDAMRHEALFKSLSRKEKMEMIQEN